jgi:class 3 adenylate cyclase/tetratricopeptide (TPR) repeat protein
MHEVLMDLVSRRCPACGQALPPEFRFCGYCGTPLGEQADGGSTRSSLSGERREVTVMFVDVTNFTAASHTMDSEQVFTWMEETIGLLAEVVDRYEGTIDKFTGDGLMALFGVPTAHENDPERAVLASLEMQQVLAPVRARVAAEYGVDFQVRIGLNTGPVIAGNIGGAKHTEYTVLGDTVNLASRLESAAAPGTVLVSASTYARTAPLFAYQVLPPLSVKGVPEHLSTYRPLGKAAQAGALRGIAGLHAPLIGRLDDLSRMQESLDALQSDLQRRIVFISGEAGMGKSRLIAEFQRRSEHLPVRIFQASCLAHTRRTPLWLVGELLRNMLGCSLTDTSETRFAALDMFLNRYGLPTDELRPYLLNAFGDGDRYPEIAARLSTLDAAILQRQTQTAVRRAFAALTQTGPLVLICDDLHWIDPASRDFLQYLIETSVDWPLMFVLASREVHLDWMPSTASDNPNLLLEISLRALVVDEGRALVDALLHRAVGEDRDLAIAIVQRAEGNPFYIEEIIRMLIEQGALALEDDAWMVAPHALEILGGVPTSLRELILARFDRLEHNRRSLLQQIAVIGRAAPERLIARLTGTDLEQTSFLLSDLGDRGLLTPMLAGIELGYAFQHALVQDAIYGTLMHRDRRRFHTLAAEAIVDLECWDIEERTEVLAFQYAESDTPKLAIPLLVEVAGRTERRFAGETAVHHYRRALSLMETYPAGHSQLAIRARIGMGRTLKFMGSFSDAGVQLEEALDRLQIAILPREEWLASCVEVLGELGDVRMREGQLERAVTHLEQGLRFFDSENDVRLPINAWLALMHRLASVRLRQGQIERALELAETAVDQADLSADPITLASLYGILGGVHYEQDQLDEAVAYTERSLDRYQSVGYTPGTASAYTNLGSLYYAQGRWQMALASLEQANQLRQAIGYMPEQALTVANLGLVRLAMGDFTQARHDLERSRMISRQIGDDFTLVRAEIGLGHLELNQDRLAEASAHLAEVDIREQAAGDDEMIQAGWLRALIAGRIGQVDEGLSLAEAALEQARATGLVEQEAECLRVLGELHGRGSNFARSVDFLRQAITHCRQRGDSYQLGQALATMGEVYLWWADTVPEARDLYLDEARTYFAEAIEQLEAIGAAHDVARSRASLQLAA